VKNKEFTLDLGEPVPVSELIAVPATRQPSPRDLALDDLVARVATDDFKDKAISWKYTPEKLVTARAAGQRAIKRNGLEGKVFVSAKADLLWFSQQRLSNRGRKSSK
jgi:hypothetical protein